MAARRRIGVLLAIALVLSAGSMAGCAAVSFPPASAPTAQASAASTPAPTTAAPSTLAATPSAELLTLDEAVAIARDYPEGCYGACSILSAEIVPWREVGLQATYGRPPGPDDPVWYIDLGRRGGPTGGQGARYAINARTGEVVGVYLWMG